MAASISIQRTSAPAPSAWKPGTRVLDDFNVERVLGRGGTGKVYLLRSCSTGRHFAAKRALVRTADARRALLRELQTWIDLPSHPHLLPCRFFRSIGDEVTLFADYVDGGSLADALADARLATLEGVLDAAIQL